MRFVDANIRLGPRLEILAGLEGNQQRIDGKRITIDVVLETMRENNVEKAVVYNVLSYQYNAAYGNKLLLNEIRGHESLLPVIMLYPTHTNEMGGPEEIYKMLNENRIKGVLLYSGLYRDRAGGNYTADEWNMGDIYMLLEEMNMPVFTRVGADFTYDEINRLQSNHPRLQIILREVNLMANRNLYGLAEHCKNLYIETTDYKAFFGIEEFVNKFGPERLVFGSGYPVQSMGGAVASILMADIKQEDKEKLAGKNLLRLMEGIKYDD
jgi:Predicted metal-dependent hydrolase of the TIM-barrel fold